MGSTGGGAASNPRGWDAARKLIADTADQVEQRIARALDGAIELARQAPQQADPERLDRNRRIMAAVLDEVSTRFEERTADLLAKQAQPPEDNRPPETNVVPAQVARDLHELNACVDELMVQLRDKEQQLKRHAEGYDAQIFKRFLYPFVLVADAIDGMIESELSKREALERLRTLLVEQALDECGVERFSPPLGSLYREAHGIDDTIQIVPTSDPSQDGLIESVVRPGYQLRPPHEGAREQVILKAKVAVYAHQRIGEPS